MAGRERRERPRVGIGAGERDAGEQRLVRMLHPLRHARGTRRVEHARHRRRIRRRRNERVVGRLDVAEREHARRRRRRRRSTAPTSDARRRRSCVGAWHRCTTLRGDHHACTGFGDGEFDLVGAGGGDERDDDGAEQPQRGEQLDARGVGRRLHDDRVARLDADRSEPARRRLGPVDEVRQRQVDRTAVGLLEDDPVVGPLASAGRDRLADRGVAVPTGCPPLLAQRLAFGQPCRCDGRPDDSDLLASSSTDSGYRFAVDAAPPTGPHTWVFDVDGTLVDSLTGTSLRPGALTLLERIKAAARPSCSCGARAERTTPGSER